jgi:quercetin dioxygenase-like cupin family protein
MSQTDLQGFLRDDTELPRSTTLVQEKGLRTLLLHLAAGEKIPEHQTRGAITVHCLKGEGALVLPDERIGLRPGLLISVPPAAPHSVAADADLLLLVTISEQIPTSSAA